MYIALVVLAVLVAGYGVLSLSQATMGAGLIAGACFLGILARMAQAATYQRQSLLASGPQLEPGQMIEVIEGRVHCPRCGRYGPAADTICRHCSLPLPFHRRTTVEGPSTRAPV